MTLGVLLNAVFMVLCWNWANAAFKKGHNIMGWLNIFASAWNGAALMVAVI